MVEWASGARLFDFSNAESSHKGPERANAIQVLASLFNARHNLIQVRGALCVLFVTTEKSGSLETEMAASPLVLALAIEHSGLEPECAIVALGAAVLCRGEVLAQQRWTAYTDQVYFEPRYWQTFWSHQQDVLAALATSGSLKEAQKAMAEGVQKFRVVWEMEALERGVPLYLVCAEPVFTVRAINRLLADYTTDRPLPFGVSPVPQHYRLWDADSLCRGWLTQADPTCHTGSEDLIQQRMCGLLQTLPIKIPDATHWPEKEACRIGLMASIALGLVSFVGI